jgi:hypothetical protein
MFSNNIYPKSPKFCVYLTTYSGNKMPIFYIGSTSIKKIQNGYRGTVLSKRYKEIWNAEIRKNPHLFKTTIIKQTHSRFAALYYEEKYQRKLNVVKSSMYVNLSFACKNGFFGRDVSKENHPRWGKKLDRPSKSKGRKLTIEEIQKIKDSHADVSGNKNPKAKHWLLISPSGLQYNLHGNLEETCKSLNLGIQLLRKNAGQIVTPHKNANHKISKNTIGWKLLEA